MTNQLQEWVKNRKAYIEGTGPKTPMPPAAHIGSIFGVLVQHGQDLFLCIPGAKPFVQGYDLGRYSVIVGKQQKADMQSAATEAKKINGTPVPATT